MPEGVEVSLLVERLNQGLENCVLTKVKVLGGRYYRHGDPKGFKGFNKSLPLKIIQIGNKGKFIYFILEDEWVIWLTLGLTGMVHQGEKVKHDHLEFITPCFNFYFNDVRNFGTIEFHQGLENLKNKLKTLGFDPLQEKISFSDFQKLLKDNQKIGEFLMNQKYVSGIGNYLRADILYQSKIHPLSLIKNIPTEKLKDLLKNIHSVMRQSYLKQKSGKYKFLIYQQNQDNLGNPVEKLKDKNGRMMWFVPNIQVLY